MNGREGGDGMDRRRYIRTRMDGCESPVKSCLLPGFARFVAANSFWSGVLPTTSMSCMMCVLA